MTLKRAYLYAVLVLLLNQCSPNREHTSMKEQANELISESSPYLLQHAYNPVKWHAWNASNLAAAKRAGKPLIISIGYSSCHWCHVMEHESFEDTEVAAYMNEHFYCIKVDREERPDVDQLYMTAANIITGRGGWPLNCFALPDSRPFHAGTYFPKANWMRVMQQVIQQFEADRPKLESYADKLTQGIRLQETAISDESIQSLSSNTLDHMLMTWGSYFDRKEGGMLRPPKFPLPSNYEFLIRYAQWRQDVSVSDFTELTLQKMAYGGLFDQVGGGFARYSTDGLWKVPHFEKMLYDNAQLLSLYSNAFRLKPTGLYKEVVIKTDAWLQREMRSEEGLYFAALDADSEGEEGKFYTWTKEELQSVLGELYPTAVHYYNINEKGFWEHGKYILLRDQTDEAIASSLNISTRTLGERIAEINDILLKHRNQRVKPGLDDKCLTSWNALLISGYTAAYRAFGEDHFLETAEQIANALINIHYRSGQLFHTSKHGEARIKGTLEDYVCTANAFLELYELNGNPRFYQLTLDLVAYCMEHFYDSNKGLFYYSQSKELLVRTVEVQDNVIPSSNALAAQILHHIGVLEGNSAYLNRSRELCGRMQSGMQRSPSGHSQWGINLMQQTTPFYEVAVIGPNAQSFARQIAGSARLNFLIAFSDKKSDLPFFQERFKKGQTLIYVCETGSCKQAVTSVQEALAQMQER